MITHFSDIESILQRHLDGDPTSVGETVHTRGKNRGGFYRLPLAEGGTVVIKAWRLRNLKEHLKAALHLSNGRREWLMHRLIHQGGIDVPEPLLFSHTTVKDGTIYEIMVIEDLGETNSGLDHFKKLISSGDESSVSAFEECLLDQTARLIDMHILDVDHQLNNFIVDAKERLIRIDFECARRFPFRIMPQKIFVEMLARLLASHVYAVQPEVTRSALFAKRLYERLNLDHQAKSLISVSVNSKLGNQHQRPGVATAVILPV